MKLLIREGILKKIKAVKHLQKVDKDIAAGLYVYAVEEFGKILLLRKAPLFNGKRRVKYDRGFVLHETKIAEAFDYFRTNKLYACLILARACGQTSDVIDGDVLVDLEANTEARLSIFYPDFVYDSNKDPVVESPPEVEPKMLKMAIEQLENATIGLAI